MKTLRNIIVTLLGIGIIFGLALWLILLVTPWMMAFLYTPTPIRDKIAISCM